MAMHETTARAGITLYPDEGNDPTIEFIQPDGTEIPTEELSEAQRFANIVTQLEKRRQKSKQAASGGGGALKRVKREGDAPTTDDDDEMSIGTSAEAEFETAIDPRAHYRPMVAELQASVVELYQLVNTVDLVRPSKAPTKEPRFLEEVHCLRDDSHLKVTKEDLAYLLTSKSSQVNDAADILLNGSKSLQAGITKERVFFTGVRKLLGKWKICAPMHGTIPKPFRAGEGLAVDCSYVSAGSTFTPQAMPISSIAYSELSRTSDGMVCVKEPEFYLRRTVKLKVENVAVGSIGSYVLPRKQSKPTDDSKFDGFGDEATTTIDDDNEVLLADIQHSIFCEEAFHTIMQEALLPSARWVDSAHHLANYLDDRTTAAGVSTNAPVSVLCIKDDEVRVRIDEHHILTVSLVDSDDNDGAADAIQDATLQESCKYALALMQHELRNFHSVCKNYHRNSALDTSKPSNQPPPTPRVLQALVTVLSHNLLTASLMAFLDTLSAKLACPTGSSAHNVVRLLEDCTCQPLCDTVRGIFVLARWKICQRVASLSSVDLHIGKNFVTEITVRGTRIHYVDLSLNQREVCGVDGFRVLVCSLLSKHVAECLYQDALALGLKKASIDNDHMTVRILAPGEWDGSFVGEGKVPDEATVGCITLQPTVSPTGHVNLACFVQAIDVAPVEAHIISDSEHTTAIDWMSLPGPSDAARLLWLLRSVGVVPDVLK
ncbi:hypothetical protein, variant 1 [Aphanomyces invadans]|uniref:Mediator of RNA polymerase II transcription subunit 17 n=1 Tax=Aphanomyces invadans TaxID=157072 RepID=A0A024U2X8_9STRA|nr:hypothetical protein, variant 1 [Aphanomyces invadans]ETV99932.1 hypothetical protein, variant 1 [Aphanomyces invadans]|eukprot:XP_008871708.1 hypothetical protein, variant 1 [Aphanomyces invadans]